MPRDLLTVDQADLPALGVHPALVDAVAARHEADPLAIRSVALLGPRSAGTTAALMVLARRIGAALRDENIRLRDRGGDLRHGRRKLCYLPGTSLPAALGDDRALRALESEGVVFIQDLDDAWAGAADAAAIDPAVMSLLALRDRGGGRTFVSADPVALPAAVREALVAGLEIVAVDGGI